jgi:hypothetical protein
MQTEITRIEALDTLLADEELSDVTLKSSLDGEQVLAHRAMLGARSRVFRHMLYGNFAESSQPVVEIQYSGETIKAIIDYIYRNKIPNLNFGREDDVCRTFDSVNTLISTIDAAAFFELPAFREKCENLAISEMKKNLSLAVSFLAASGRYASLPATDTMEFAVNRISSSPDLLLEHEDIISLLSYSQVESLLQARNLRTDEFSLFLVLQVWARGINEESTTDGDIDVDNSLNGEKSSSDDEVETCGRKRKKDAVNLCKHINLALIEPSTLLSTVSTSGFVSQEQLFETFKDQALRAEKRTQLQFSIPRCPTVWKLSDDKVFCNGSGSDCIAILRCKELISGIHKWTISVESERLGFYGTIAAGVASCAHQLDRSKYLGKQPGGWVVDNTGYRSHDSSIYSDSGLTFRSGDAITFILDLTGTGVLSAHVKGRENHTVQLFSDMSSAFEGGRKAACFVPAVDLKYKGDKVRFHGFEKV